MFVSFVKNFFFFQVPTFVGYENCIYNFDFKTFHACGGGGGGGNKGKIKTSGMENVVDDVTSTESLNKMKGKMADDEVSVTEVNAKET